MTESIRHRAGRLRLAFAVVLTLGAAAASGCREGYLPYYDDAPEAWLVAYDDRHADRIEERRELLDQIAAHPRDYRAIRLLASEEWNSGRQVEAVKVLDYLLVQLNGQDAEAPTSPDARLALIDKVRYLAMMPYEGFRFETARRILDRFAPADRDADYWYAAGLLADRAAAQDPDPARQIGERARALTLLDEALKVNPQHAEALQLRARLAFAAGDWRRVIDLCGQWSQALPGDGRAWYTQGVALQRLKQYEAAIPMFETAVRLEPDQPDPWYGLAIAHMAGGNREAADGALREVIRIKPTHAQAYFKLFLLYSDQPLDDARYELLVRAATLARRDPSIQQALIDATRMERPQRGDLLLFGLKNLMNLELEHGARLNLAPLVAFADEAERQGLYEEAFFALADPLRRAPTFDGPHPAIGLRLLRLASHWIDPETGHWNPPSVALLDSTRPLAAENIGRPVQFKAILDAALVTGRFMFEADAWSDFVRLAVDGELPRARRPDDPPVLADQLAPADREELVLLIARINVARNEHMRRILRWHQVLTPIVPFNLKMVVADAAGAPRPAFPAPVYPGWWLQNGWDPFRQEKVSDLLVLDDSSYSRAVSSLSAMGPLLIEELRAGLSRDNYGDLSTGMQIGYGDIEMLSTMRDGQYALDLLTQMDDPLRRGDSPEARARHRAWSYLQIELAALLPAGVRADGRMQRMLRSVQQAVDGLPGLLAEDPTARRRAEIRRAAWCWLMRQGDQARLREEFNAARQDAFVESDAYACGVRIWLRAVNQNRADAGRGSASLNLHGTLRQDLEGMLAGMSQYDSVPAMRMRMQISTAVGLAFGDDSLAAAAAENLARIEATTENGQETQVLLLLSMIYEKQNRWLPAIYCLRRAIARRVASNQANAADQRRFQAVSFDAGEEIRLLRWRLHNLWQRLGRDAQAYAQLLEIADYGEDGQPVNATRAAEKSAARAAALYALAARRMATGALKDCYNLCYEAYTSYESINDKIEQYRLTYCLIALAADPAQNRERVRENIQRDQLGARAFRADNARVLEAFDAALQGQTSLLLETPAAAEQYLLPARQALELALAIQAARAGKAEAVRAHLHKAEIGTAQGRCAGISGMTRAISMLCDAWLARQRGDQAAWARARQAWLDQGGLAEFVTAPGAAKAAGAAPADGNDPATPATPAPADNPPIGN